MNSSLVVFTLEDRHYALRLAAVERVIRIVEITPLPQAPEIVIGVVNVQGEIIPVVNVRQRFGLPQREISLSDQLIIAHISQRKVGLIADAVMDVIEYSEQDIAAAESILPDMEHVDGILKLPDGLVLIHDLDKFLSLEEEASLEQALT